MAKAIFIHKSLPMMNFIDFDGSLDWYYSKIGCNTIDIVHAYGLDGIAGLENIDIICDDEGLLDDAPEVNILASLLYGAAVHGQPIVGNVIISAHDAAGNDIGLTDQQIQKIACFLAR